MKQRLVRTSKNLVEAYRHSFSRVNPSPIIILGHQKTGTSATAVLLAKATNKSVTVDFFHKNYERLPFAQERLYNEDLDFPDFIMSNKLYFSTDIVKEPELTFFYKELSGFFPSAKFVFVARDPRATIRSVLNRLDISGNLECLDEEHFESMKYLKIWRFVLSGKLPDVPGETYIEKLAHRWNLAAETYLKNCERITMLKYESFKQNKKESIEKLAGSLGLAVESNISDDVDTQFQPCGNHIVTYTDFFGTNNLDKIESICGEQMNKLGYAAQVFSQL